MELSSALQLIISRLYSPQCLGCSTVSPGQATAVIQAVTAVIQAVTAVTLAVSPSQHSTPLIPGPSRSSHQCQQWHCDQASLNIIGIVTASTSLLSHSTEGILNYAEHIQVGENTPSLDAALISTIVLLIRT